MKPITDPRFRRNILMGTLILSVVAFAFTNPPWFIKVWQGRAHLLLGGIYRIAGNTASALSHYKEARDICNNCSAGKYEMRALVNMGDIYFESGNVSEGEKYYHEAIKAAKEAGYCWGECVAYHSLAIVYDDLADYHKALWYYSATREAAASMTFIKYPTDAIADRMREITEMVW